MDRVFRGLMAGCLEMAGGMGVGCDVLCLKAKVLYWMDLV